METIGRAARHFDHYSVRREKDGLLLAVRVLFMGCITCGHEYVGEFEMAWKGC